MKYYPPLSNEELAQLCTELKTMSSLDKIDSTRLGKALDGELIRYPLISLARLLKNVALLTKPEPEPNYHRLLSHWFYRHQQLAAVDTAIIVDGKRHIVRICPPNPDGIMPSSLHVLHTDMTGAESPLWRIVPGNSADERFVAPGVTPVVLDLVKRAILDIVEDRDA